MLNRVIKFMFCTTVCESNMGISEKSNQLYGATFKALGLTAGVIFFGNS